MSISIFAVIREDFVTEMDAIRQLVTAFDGQGQAAKTRVAAANSATLLVAATFEEFVREVAREHARAVVTRTTQFEDLPNKLAQTVWKRSMENLARIRFDVDSSARESVTLDAQIRFSAVHAFIKGDLSQDIYSDLIHNDNNMRPTQLNSLFSVAGLRDMCSIASRESPLLSYFGESEPGKSHGRLLLALDDFFDRRNAIAHALNPSRSSGSAQILLDLDMLLALSEGILLTLEKIFPP